MIPPVVVNALLTSGNTVRFTDDINWVGHSYVLHQFPEYKVIDSAQKLEKNQFKECENQDVMIFSFYPTKPLGGIDGGMVVTNDYIKHKRMKELSINGMKYSENSWDRNVKFPGYKMYMNSFQAEIILKNFHSFERKMQVLGDIVGLYNQELGYAVFSRHLYRIEVHDNLAFINAMKKDGIACGIHYTPLHLHPTYKHLNLAFFKSPSHIPVNYPYQSSIFIDELPETGNSLYVKTEELAPHTVSLPMNETMTKQDIQHVISSVRKHDARLER